MKDLTYSKKEIESQQARIEATKANPEKDEHDVRKQQEVLQEYLDTVPREQEALYKGFDALLTFISDEDLPSEVKDSDEHQKAVDALTAASPILIECGKLEPEDKYPPDA